MRDEMVVKLAGVEIYRANLTPLKIEINGNPFYELTREQVEEMNEANNGNSLWKALVGELGNQRPDRYFRKL